MEQPNKESEINQLIKQLYELCYTEQIPVFAIFGTGQEPDGSYKTTSVCILPEIFGQTNDPRFADFVNVMNGFTTIPKAQDSTFETLDDF